MANRKSLRSSVKGQRVFTCGHSFHHWVDALLIDLSKAAGIRNHVAVGTSCIGGSRVIQHWDVPEDQNEAKKFLRAGTVDVLTLSCMTQPDEGIRNFAKLAVEHNPNVIFRSSIASVPSACPCPICWPATRMGVSP
jgi:hypothetical protein